ncbi:hypothetical protein GCM10027082_37490 [Comamonas humi]
MLGLDSWVDRWRTSLHEGTIAVEDRMDLLALEWRQQKQYLQYLLVVGLVAAGLTIVALVALSTAIVVHFWDTPSRVTAAWCVALVWMVAWVAVLVSLVGTVRKASQAFSLSRRELRKDWRTFKGRL